MSASTMPRGGSIGPVDTDMPTAEHDPNRPKPGKKPGPVLIERKGGEGAA